jgi:hypothetical protein
MWAVQPFTKRSRVEFRKCAGRLKNDNEGMDNAPKSEALLRFEREVALLKQRVANGQCPNPVEEYGRILRETRPGMAEPERRLLQTMELQAHQRGVEILAQTGLAVPDNNPDKPN